MPNLARLLALLAVLALAGCPSSDPCPCRCPSEELVVGPALAQPLGGTAVYPPNTRLLLQFARYDAGSVALRDEMGADVPFALEPAGDAAGMASWLVPAAPLAAGMYTLSARSRVGGGSVGAVLEVGGEPDTVAPVLADFGVYSFGDEGYECGLVTGGSMGHRTNYYLDGAWVYEEGVVFEVEVEQAGSVVGTAFTSGIVGTASMPDCLGAGHLPGMTIGTATLRVHAWDLGGNRVDLGSHELTVRSQRANSYPCARWCSVSPGRAPAGILPWAALAWLAAVLRPRRGR
jgi:hypothetical protein